MEGDEVGIGAGEGGELVIEGDGAAEGGEGEFFLTEDGEVAGRIVMIEAFGVEGRRTGLEGGEGFVSAA
jgi:hypothetical protein